MNLPLSPPKYYSRVKIHSSSKPEVDTWKSGPSHLLPWSRDSFNSKHVRSSVILTDQRREFPALKVPVLGVAPKAHSSTKIDLTGAAAAAAASPPHSCLINRPRRYPGTRSVSLGAPSTAPLKSPARPCVGADDPATGPTPNFPLSHVNNV